MRASGLKTRPAPCWTRTASERKCAQFGTAACQQAAIGGERAENGPRARLTVTVTLVTTSHGEAEMAKVSEDGIFDLGEGRQRQDGVGRSCRFPGVSPRRGGWDGPTALRKLLNADTWAVGPGWYRFGPLALGEYGPDGCGVWAGVMAGPLPSGKPLANALSRSGRYGFGRLALWEQMARAL
jgi:hypothetical protein